MLDSKVGMALLERGRSPEEINSLLETQRTKLLERGHSEEEVTKFLRKRWGAPKPDVKLASDYALEMGAVSTTGEETSEPNPETQKLKDWHARLTETPKEAKTFAEVAVAGYQNSALGLYNRESLPNMQLGEDATWADKAVFAASMMASELPIAIPAAAITTFASANPFAGMFAGGAAPAGMREYLLDLYESGEVKNMGEGIDRFLRVSKAALTEGTIGLMTAKTGSLARHATAPLVASGQMSSKVATGLAAYAELNTAAYSTAAMQLRAVNADDFIVGGALMGAQRNIAFYTGKLKQLYALEGVSPAHLEWLSKKEPTTLEDLASVNRVLPRMIKGFSKLAERANPEMAKEIYRDIETYDQAAQAVAKALKGNASEADMMKALTAADKVHKIYTDYVDKLHPLNKGAKAGETTDSYMEARLNAALPAKAQSMLQHAMIDYYTQKPSGESLSDALRGIKDTKEFEAWVQTKQYQKAIDSGASIKAVVEKVFSKNKKKFDALDAMDPDKADIYQGAYDRLAKYNEGLIKYAEDSGVLTKNQADLLRGQHDLFAMLDDSLTVMSKQKLQKTFGSDSVPNPIEAMIHNTHTILKASDINYTKQLAADDHGFKILLKRTDDVIVQHKDGSPENIDISRFDKEFVIHSVKENGADIQYAMPKEIADVFANMDNRSMGAVTRLLKHPASWLRAGTAATPDFILKNYWRDGLQASVNSQHGFIFGIDSLKGTVDIIGAKMYEASGKSIPSLKGIYDTYTEWTRSGGANSALVSIDRDYLGETAKQLYKAPVRNLVTKEGLYELGARLNTVNEGTPVWKTAGKMAKAPVTGPLKFALKALQVASETSDQATRLSEYKRARAAGKSAREAAYASREVTQDFARVGARTSAYNAITAFANAQIQGTDRFAREFRARPLATMFKAQAGIVLPSFILALVQQDIVMNAPDSDMAQAIKNAPLWEKNMYWLMPGDDNVLYRVPKPFELGQIFGSTTERFVEYAAQSGNVNPGEVLEHFFDIGLFGSIGESAVPSMIPTAAAPMLDIAFNKNYFTGLPLVPSSQERVLPELQSTMMTSELSKTVSAAVYETIPFMHKTPDGMQRFFSPIGLDHILKSWTGGTGRYVIAATERLYKENGWESVDNKPDIFNLQHPFTKAFTVRYPTSSAEPVMRFRNDYKTAEQTYNSVMMLAQQGRVDDEKTQRLLSDPKFYRLPQISNTFRKISGTIKSVYYAPSMREEEKYELINYLYKQLIDVAITGNDIIKNLELDDDSSNNE